MKYWLIMMVGMICWPIVGEAHDIHISMVQIDYNEQTRSLEITVKAYTDDYELAVSKSEGPVCKLNTDLELPNSDEYLLAYLRKVLKIEVNDEQLELSWVGKEYEDLATWSYLEIKMVEGINTIDVTYTQHMEVYADQNNIVHVKVNGEKKSTVLTKYDTHEQFYF